MSTTVNEILKQAFPSLEAQDLDMLASVATIHSYPAGVTLCQEGAHEDTFYVVVEGEVEITKQLTPQDRMILKRMQGGEFFGEIALVQEGPRTATVVTLRPTTLLEIRREDFRSLLHQSASLAVRIMLQMALHLRDADVRTIMGLRAKNEELAAAYAALEEQEQLRSEFLTCVAHELRTPLTSALGYLHFISAGTLPPAQVSEMAATVDRNLKTVVHLVNNILFLQELDLIKPEREEVHVGELVMEVVQAQLERAAQQNLNFVTHVAPQVPTISADATSLSRAIDALVDNAIKFSPDGGEIQVRVQSEPAAGEIHITICDPGVGFPPEALEELFKPFTRFEDHSDHIFGGVGLGLPIAKHVVELHGGHLSAQSNGHGSTFTVVLPVEQGKG